MTAAVGCDYSTIAVNFARVSDCVEELRVVKLNPTDFAANAFAVNEVLCAWRPLAQTILVERPFIHPGEKQNFGTSLKLAAVATMVATCAALDGWKVEEMLASEWRPLAGINYTTGNGARSRVLGRTDLKRAALDLVKLEFSYATTNDNVAEAILMGRVAGILERQRRLGMRGAS